MRILIRNIKGLLQIRPIGIDKIAGRDMAGLPQLENAFLLLDGEKIAAFGPMHECPPATGTEIIDAGGCYVLPTWCDSHTHLVYAGNREQEFADRIRGMTYEEIAARGGGILNSAATLNATSEDGLFLQSEMRLQEIMRLGTGAVEIKSGYGLTVEGELKMLRVIRRLKEKYPVAVRATFLGAHAFPTEFKNDHEGYLDQICGQMLPAIASENLADYIDAFCEPGYFSVDETIRMMEAGKKYGLQAKIHVNQFNAIGGVEACVGSGARSVDHLEVLEERDIEALARSQTMPVALPGCSYFLSIPYTPARRLISAGLPLALATDFNPGSAPSGNMNFVVATACIKMRMTPEEAINAATLNGAYAMGLQASHGSIAVGKSASVIITKPISSFYQLPYAFGSNLIKKVIVAGKIIA
jgi:imidazolonepropionase